MLTPTGCRTRQQRLLRVLEANEWDVFLTGNYRTVYYLTGVLSQPDSPTVFVLWSDGTSALIGPATEGAATEIVPLETYSIHRSITQPAHDAAVLAGDILSKRPVPRRSAVERSGTNALLDRLLPDAADATTSILLLRKRKEEDEVEEIRRSLGLCAVAYRAAREVLRAGLTEIDVYNAMNAAVVQSAGTVVPFPGDFACGRRSIRGGGPPTSRVIEAGDLYILDLFPAPALYFGDTCRTFAVTEPTDVQLRAWEAVRHAAKIGEEAIKPNVAAKDVYNQIKDFLDSEQVTEKSFWHHAGHGIGHNGHEAPRIIPGTDDIFEVGDVFTLEPGVYTEALQGGIRIEDNYLLTESGLVNLFEFPKEL
jgi:Xaa-Pro dipeptidase